MIHLVFLLVVAGASDTARMLDRKLNVAQRNDACFAIRGDASPEAIEAALRALHDPATRACAAQNLRAANADTAVQQALGDEDPEVRAVAARILGTFEKPEFAPLLAKAALDGQMLVATNALEGLASYRDGSVVAPYLLPLSKRTGIVGSLAMEQLIRLKEPRALAVGRELLRSPEPADLLTGMRVLGALGDRSDIAVLEAVEKRFPEAVSTTPARGFGLMPAISLARAAKSAIAQIESRL